jgi:hypothetical protein
VIAEEAGRVEYNYGFHKSNKLKNYSSELKVLHVFLTELMKATSG